MVQKIWLSESKMAKLVAYADSRLLDCSRSEHHYCDKATKAENVKEQCPGGGSPGMSAERDPMLRYGAPI